LAGQPRQDRRARSLLPRRGVALGLLFWYAAATRLHTGSGEAAFVGAVGFGVAVSFAAWYGYGRYFARRTGLDVVAALQWDAVSWALLALGAVVTFYSPVFGLWFILIGYYIGRAGRLSFVQLLWQETSQEIPLVAITGPGPLIAPDKVIGDVVDVFLSDRLSGPRPVGTDGVVLGVLDLDTIVARLDGVEFEVAILVGNRLADSRGCLGDELDRGTGNHAAAFIGDGSGDVSRHLLCDGRQRGKRPDQKCEKDARTAAAALLQGMTALSLLHTPYPPRDGDTALIHADAARVAGGGVAVAELVEHRLPEAVPAERPGGGEGQLADTKAADLEQAALLELASARRRRRGALAQRPRVDRPNRNRGRTQTLPGLAGHAECRR